MRVKALGPDAPPAMALDTFCLLPRPPRCGPCSRTKSSGRMLTIRPTLNVPLAPFLRQSCGHCPRCWTKVSPSAASSATPAPDVPPPPPFLLPPPRLRSPRSRLTLRHCFSRFRSANASFGVRPKDRVGVLVVGYQQGLDEGNGRGGSRLSSIGRTIHASPGCFH